MSDMRSVLARLESDFDFYLAVVGGPRAALAPFKLSPDEVEAFAHPGMPLWNLVLRHIARESLGKPDGGLPPPPPPFIVHYSIPIDFEPWRGDREADLDRASRGPCRAGCHQDRRGGEGQCRVGAPQWRSCWSVSDEFND